MKRCQWWLFAWLGQCNAMIVPVIDWLTNKSAAQYVPRARKRWIWEQQVWQSLSWLILVLEILVFDQHQCQVRTTGSKLPISTADNRKSATLPRTGGNPHLPRRPQRHLGQDWGGEHSRLQQGHLLDPPHRLPHALRQYLVLALLCDSATGPFLLWTRGTPRSGEG